MKNYFVRYGDFANTYHVACCESTESDVIHELTRSGYERITRKKAESLCRRERERRLETPNMAGYANVKIERVWLDSHKMFIFEEA